MIVKHSFEDGQLFAIFDEVDDLLEFLRLEDGVGLDEGDCEGGWLALGRREPGPCLKLYFIDRIHRGNIYTILICAIINHLVFK